MNLHLFVEKFRLDCFFSLYRSLLFSSVSSAAAFSLYIHQSAHQFKLYTLLEASSGSDQSKHSKQPRASDTSASTEAAERKFVDDSRILL